MIRALKNCNIFVSTFLLTLQGVAATDFAKISAIEKSSDRNYVFISAHRGLVDPAKGIPENSAASIKYAIKEGIDIVEVDPKATRDRRIILCHNYRNIGDIMEFEVPVSGMLTSLDIPYEAEPGHPCFKRAKLKVSKELPIVTEERPLLWEDLLDLCKGKCFIHADCTRWNGIPDWKMIWEPVVARGMEEQVLFNLDGDNKGLVYGGKPPAKMRRYFYDSAMWDSNNAVPEKRIQEVLASSQRLTFLPIGRYGHDLTGEYGDRVSIDLDPKFGWAKLLDLGATVLMTDYGVELRDYLESVGRRTAKPKAKAKVYLPFQANEPYDGTKRIGEYSKKAADGHEIWWRVLPMKSEYKDGKSFLQYLANHKNRVESSPKATGGDVILKYIEGGKDHYLHVFTNTALTATFQPKAPLKVRALVVGAGGGAGKSYDKGPWKYFLGSGGNGGEVLEKLEGKVSKSVEVRVGAGGAATKSGEDSAFGSLVAAGGKAGVSAKEGVRTLHGAGANGKGGEGLPAYPIANNAVKGGGDGVESTIFTEKLTFGGGGAAAINSTNGGSWFRYRGGRGGGGDAAAASYKKELHYSHPGVDGLGGGGAGGCLSPYSMNAGGSRGGSGLVVVSY